MQEPRPHYEHVQALLRAQPRTWLVTGVAGFIGSHLLQTLLELNQRVVGLDNFSTGRHSNLDDVRPLLTPTQWAQFDFIEGDIRDLPDCLRACEGVDHVVHQAALGSPQHSGADPIACNDVNVSGFLNMLVAARDCRVKSFTYASSDAVYGEHPDPPQQEHHTGHPLSVFGASKLNNEQYAQVFARQHGLGCTGLRYFDVFGPRQDPNGPDAALVPQWLAALRRGEPVYIPGDGEVRRDFCYVANVVQANLLAAMAAEAPAPRATAWREGRSKASHHAQSLVYNAGMGERVCLNTLFALLRLHLSAYGVSPSAQPVHQDNRAGSWGDSQADMRQARKHLGYAPTHSLLQGLIETLPALPSLGSSTTRTNSIQQDAAFGGSAGVPANALVRVAPAETVDHLAPCIGRLLTRQTP